MVRNGWQVHELQAHLAEVRLPAGLDDLAADWGSWFAGTGIPAGTPFLISPDMQYDVVANAFFASTDMLMLARTTQPGYASNLAAFLHVPGELGRLVQEQAAMVCEGCSTRLDGPAAPAHDRCLGRGVVRSAKRRLGHQRPP